MDAAGDKLLEELRAVVSAAEHLLGGRASEGKERLREEVRQHPLAALAIAAALGVVLGVLIARK